MKKRSKALIIVMAIIGLILILIGIVYGLTNSKKTEVNKPSPSVEPTSDPTIIDKKPTPTITEKEEIIITKEEALQTIKNIYDTDNLVISFKEEVDDIYIFEQKNSDAAVFNTFKFNKKTGQINQEENLNPVPNF